MKQSLSTLQYSCTVFPHHVELSTGILQIVPAGKGEQSSRKRTRRKIPSIVNYWWYSFHIHKAQPAVMLPPTDGYGWKMIWLFTFI